MLRRSIAILQFEDDEFYQVYPLVTSDISMLWYIRNIIHELLEYLFIYQQWFSYIRRCEIYFAVNFQIVSYIANTRCFNYCFTTCTLEITSSYDTWNILYTNRSVNLLPVEYCLRRDSYLYYLYVVTSVFWSYLSWSNSRHTTLTIGAILG